MIHKVERGESSPTATLLGKLSGAFGLTVSTLIARGEPRGTRVLSRADQELWIDPDTGYERRQILTTPAGDITEIVMPAGKEVAVPAESYDFGMHVVWVVEGVLTFVVAGEESHELAAGDRLRMGDPAPVIYRNASTKDVRYVVTVFGRPPTRSARAGRPGMSWPPQHDQRDRPWRSSRRRRSRPRRRPRRSPRR